MGATESRKKIGERVAAAKQELQEQKGNALSQIKLWTNKDAKEVTAQDSAIFVKLLDNLVDLIGERAHVPENMLFYGWYVDSSAVSNLILPVCKKILNPDKPNEEEYQWLRENILSSLIWCLECEDKKYLFEKLNDIVGDYATHVAKELSSTYSRLEKDKRFNELTQIEDKTIINRQDNEQVGLLKNLVNDVDEKDDSKEGITENIIEDRKQFVNIYIGLARLISVGKKLNNEFCDYMHDLFKPLFDDYRMVEFRRAPIKTFDRCHAKV